MAASEKVQIILSNTFSRQAADHRLALLKAFLEDTIYSGAYTEPSLDVLRGYLADHADEETAQAMQEWGEQFYADFTADSMYDVIHGIEDELSRMPQVVLYVPVTLPEPEIEHIAAWFRGTVQARTLFELHADPSVIGGCGFIWNGHYYDYSLSRLMRYRRDEIASALASYDG
jgi:hypothetical protein